jgi:predicted ribosomally synthesized peptide with SipW-like signal peptide
MPSVRRAAAVTLGATAAFGLGIALSGTGHTFASFSDFQTVQGSAEAGVWAPDPPDACGELSQYETVIYGTPGDDQLGLTDTNHPQLILGYGGNDTLIGGNQKDCLVGGEGSDHIFGNNAIDILLGGAGDDFIDGGNAEDSIDGGGGASDVCLGGNGHDTIVNCETLLSDASGAGQEKGSLDGETNQLLAPETLDTEDTSSPGPSASPSPTASEMSDPVVVVVESTSPASSPTVEPSP